MKHFISIGSTYGQVNVDDVLPCRTTISRHMDGVVEVEKARLLKELDNVHQFGITTDLWSHDSTGHSYITVTAQYITEWEVKSKILATRVLDERHTAENVKVTVNAILEEFHAERPNNVFVTDNASNMRAAFREKTWIGCACHNLNLVLSHSFERQHSDDDIPGMPDEVLKLVDVCKDIVTIGKRSKLNAKLEKTLKQCVSTRWNSVLTTLQSVASNIDNLRTLSSDMSVSKNILRHLADLNEILLREVIDVLLPFDTATRCLSADKSVTMHLILPTRHKLFRGLQVLATDSAVISQMKTRVAKQLEKYFPISDLHRTAVLLDPRLKDNVTLLEADDRHAATESLRRLVESVEEEPHSSQTAGQSHSSQGTSDEQEPAQKKRKEDDGFFSDFYTTASAATVNEVNTR